MEVFKDIKGYNGVYKISSNGYVISYQCDKAYKNKGIVLKNILNSKGYYYVRLYKDTIYKTISIHKLIALHFIQNPKNKKCVNHKNGIKTDNMVENLEWCSYSENNKHAYDSGLRISTKGESQGNSKLTKEDVIKIKSMLKYKTGRSIADIFNVTEGTISAIKNKRNWKHIKED